LDNVIGAAGSATASSVHAASSANPQLTQKLAQFVARVCGHDEAVRGDCAHIDFTRREEQLGCHESLRELKNRVGRNRRCRRHESS